MLEFGGQACELTFDFQYGNSDLYRYCEPGADPHPELTEGELQQFEQRAEDWYLSML